MKMYELLNNESINIMADIIVYNDFKDAIEEDASKTADFFYSIAIDQINQYESESFRRVLKNRLEKATREYWINHDNDDHDWYLQETLDEPEDWWRDNYVLVSCGLM